MSLFQYIHINSVEKLSLACIYSVELKIYDIINVRYFFHSIRQRTSTRVCLGSATISWSDLCTIASSKSPFENPHHYGNSNVATPKALQP